MNGTKNRWLGRGVGLATVLLSTLAGCAGGSGAVADRAGPRDPAADARRLMVDLDVPPERARGVPVFDAQGRAATWADLVHAARGAEVVLIGETHGHPLGLAAAAALFDDVIATGARPALALEFFERDRQVALDDLLAGVTDEAGMLAAAGIRSPGSYPPGHRAMVLAAKRAGLPVVAANAPRRYVRLARLEGYQRLAALGPEQGRLFDLPHRDPSASYRAAFDQVMNANAGVSDAGRTDPAVLAQRRGALDATFRSQWLWDWTMGSSAARAMPLGRPVVLVAGVFHVQHDGGTAQALRALRPDARVLSVVFVDEPAGAGAAAPGRADFVVPLGRP